MAFLFWRGKATDGYPGLDVHPAIAAGMRQLTTAELDRLPWHRPAGRVTAEYDRMTVPQRRAWLRVALGGYPVAKDGKR